MNLSESTFKQEAVIVALKKLFDSSWFNVSALNDIAKLCDIVIPSEQQKIFQALHCVHYNTMSKDFREDLVEVIKKIFEDFFQVEAYKMEFTEIVRELEHIKK